MNRIMTALKIGLLVGLAAAALAGCRWCEGGGAAGGRDDGVNWLNDSHDWRGVSSVGGAYRTQ